MEKTQYSSKQYRKEKDLPCSTYAKVYIATDEETGTKVVVKRLETVLSGETINTMIRREHKLIKLAQESKNPHIVELITSFQERHIVYLVMKHYEQGNLQNYLQAKGGKLPEKDAWELFKKICKGYDWWVTHGVVHRDLKCTNILMHDDEPAICDFGSARLLNEGDNTTMSVKQFSVFNLSPEQLKPGEEESYGTEVDIWALGLILYELIYGVHPFQKDGCVTEESILYEECRFDDSIEVSLECKQIIFCMLLKDKKSRTPWTELRTLMNLSELGSPKKIPIKNFEEKPKVDVKPTLSKSQLKGLYDSAMTFTQAVLAIRTCQKLVSEIRSKNFLPFKTFLIFTYGLIKVSIINLRLALSYARTSERNEEFTDILNQIIPLKTQLEEFYYSQVFLKMLGGFPELSLSFRQRMFSPLTNNIQIDHQYIEHFKEWINDEGGALVMHEAWKYREELNTEAGVLTKSIYDVLATLKNSHITKIVSLDEEVPKSNGVKTNTPFAEELSHSQQIKNRVSTLRITYAGPIRD